MSLRCDGEEPPGVMRVPGKSIKKKSGCRAEIQRRDLNWFRMIEKARGGIRTRTAVPLLFRSKDVARRRFRILARAGFLIGEVESTTSDTRWYVTPLARSLVTDE